MTATGSVSIDGPYISYPQGGMPPNGTDSIYWDGFQPLAGTFTVTAQADPQAQGDNFLLNTNYSVALGGLAIGNVTTAEGDIYFTTPTYYATFVNDGDATITNYWIYISWVKVP